MNFHVFPIRTSLMTSLQTPKSLAIRAADIERGKASILGISDSFSLAIGRLSPLQFLPLESMSSILSCRVPRKRCAGLQHGGLSQVWHTKRSIGNSPFAREKAITCAPIARDILGAYITRMLPYPYVSQPPSQGQHSWSPRRSTFDKNLRRSFSQPKTVDDKAARVAVSNFLNIAAFLPYSSKGVNRGAAFSILS